MAKKKKLIKKVAARRSPVPVPNDEPDEEHEPEERENDAEEDEPPEHAPAREERDEPQEAPADDDPSDDAHQQAEAADPFDLAGSPKAGEARIYALSAELGRVWGTHTAMPMSMAPVVNIQRMPIGILEFDFRTGGGIVIGRTNRLKGKKDTLKSTMCLRALRAAQRTCRHCKFGIARTEAGRLNCRCPAKRYWIGNEEDYVWLPAEAAIKLFHGLLPDGAQEVNTSAPFLMCDPPPHLAGKKGAGGKVMKRRPIAFKQMFRCEPMRTAMVDTERTTDLVWVRKNGVNPALVGAVGSKWAEQTLESVERIALTGEFDFIVIDSTSMMETREMLEDRKVGDRGTPAGKQKLMGDFIKRVQAAQADEGLAGRYAPTLLTTSHLTTKGMGYGQHTHLGATDGLTVEHGVAMDILMKADKFIFDAAKQKAIYGQFTFTIDKNHCGGMGSTKTSGAIKFWLIDTPDHPVGDSNDLETVIAYARQFGDGFISEGRGTAKLILHSPHLSGERKPFASIVRCKEFLKKNEGVYDDLRARVLTKLIEDRASLSVVEAEEPEGVAQEG
jgi:RecA/RadA recombinase